MPPPPSSDPRPTRGPTPVAGADSDARLSDEAETALSSCQDVPAPAPGGIPGSGPISVEDALRTAQEARAAVDRDPRRAAELSQAVLDGTDAAEPVSVALRALALALRELGNTRSAIRLLRRAARVADQAGLATRAAEARLSLVPVLVERGDTDGAQAAADAAASVFRTGPDAARLALQQALILQVAGRTEAALAHYGTAIPVLRKAGDIRYECIGLLRRGGIHAHRGDHASAERDLERCAMLARAGDHELLYAFAEHNLAFAALQRGDLPLALDRLEVTFRLQTDLGQPVADLRLLRAEVLIAAGLAAEAREQLTAAIEEYTALGSGGSLALAEVRLAEAALLGGDPSAAGEAASSAHAAFSKQRRPGGAALARHFRAEARWAAGERDEDLLRESLGATEDLDVAGWLAPALAGRFLAGRVAEAVGRPELAHKLLAECAGHRQRGTAYMRATAWHAEALLRVWRGDTRGAASAARAGLRMLAENAATLGATELRVHAAGRGEDLARLGLDLALGAGRPRGVLEWSERWRAGALRTRPVRPAPDEDLRADLAELRHVTRLIDEAATSAPDPDSAAGSESRPAGSDVRRLRLRQRRLESRVRDRARLARGGPPQASPLDVGELMDVLADRALVELVQVGDDLMAVTVCGGRIRRVPLPGAPEAQAEAEWLRFHLHELARGFGPARAREAADAGAEFAARRAGDLLLRPLARYIGDRELVIVPTGPLHALPWPVLPSCAGRVVSVAPSAGMWLRAMRTPPTGAGGVLLAAGPGLDQVDAEVEAIARHLVETAPPTPAPATTDRGGRLARPVVLTGRDATADAVQAAMDGAHLAHVAAHGRFQPGNPQLSYLALADGPLYVYDLERLRRAPDCLVLSACDVGLSAVRPGDELMGLAGAVFTLGTRTLIASVVPVPDDETRGLMTEVYRRLAAGDSPAHALAAAQEHARVPGFVCFGAG